MPLISEYKHAIRFAEDSFKDLVPIEAVLDEQGELRFASGAFAVVFRMRKPDTGRLAAIKCFYRDAPQRHERLQQIASYLRQNPSAYFVGYQYLPEELWVNSAVTGDAEYPVVYMEWAEGVTLFEKVQHYCNTNNKTGLQQLSDAFNEMALWLLAQPIAHGDLKHDNILVSEAGKIVLVDYDGMYLPQLASLGAAELGGADYQHPMRNESHYNRHIDDYSIAVIAVSLQALALQPELFGKYNGGNNLIISRTDLLTTTSPLLQTLRHLNHPTINQLLTLLQESIVAQTLQLPGLAQALQTQTLHLPPTIAETQDLIATKEQELIVIQQQIIRLNTHLQTLQQRPTMPAHMKFIKGGAFDMGDVFGDNHYAAEKPVHSVTVGDFYMSAYCVTFEEYDAFCAATGRQKPDDRGWGRGNRPVINVNWYNAVEYCNWLSRQQGLTPIYAIDKTRQDPNSSSIYDNLKWIVTPNWNANGYRLPTEAEWEYAAREGGKRVRFGNGQNTLRPTEANFDASASYKEPYSEVGQYRSKTVPVDTFKPNALGLYNMSGNVWEWCQDWYDSAYYKNSPKENPKGPASGTYRVLRGGGWYGYAQYCRVSHRNIGTPTARCGDYGFRLSVSP